MELDLSVSDTEILKNHLPGGSADFGEPFPPLMNVLSQAPHNCLVELESLFPASPGGLLMRAHAGTIEEGHSELDPALLHHLEQALPDTQWMKV